MSWLRRHSSQSKPPCNTWDELLQQFRPGLKVSLEGIGYFISSLCKLHADSGTVWVITFLRTNGECVWLEVPESHSSLHAICWNFVEYAGNNEQDARTLTVTGVAAEPCAFYATSHHRVPYTFHDGYGRSGWYTATRFQSPMAPQHEISIEYYNSNPATMNFGRPMSIQDITISEWN